MSAAIAAPLLREDGPGIPLSLPLLAVLVEAEARLFAATAVAFRPADSGLVRAFRGGAAPKVPIRVFMERIHLRTRSVPATRGMVQIDGTAFVLIGIYLTCFIRSAAGREVGILVTARKGAIRADEMAELEGRFLRAIDFRLSVDSVGFDSFCKVLEQGPRAPSTEGGCANKKRQTDVAVGEDDERRRVRARLPVPASCPIRITV
ncbi:unnamed protein product [Urochloa decumbens]|uniref:Uncharacterized protein n=1 Tax=Urochloa decumbens TaxID=240449 RepID=A0ABC9DFP9_9POAL